MYQENLFSHNWLIKKALNAVIGKRLKDLHGVVVDLGCGSRPFEPDIRQHADAYYGIDWMSSYHESVADIVANLNVAIPLLDQSVDHVVSFEVLEHLSSPHVMLSEALRVLRSGGELTVTVPFQWWEHEEPWDFFRYTSHGLRHLLESAGFDSIIVVPTTGFWSMWILKLNYHLARLIRGSALTRKAIRLLLIPVWWVGQTAARFLDNHWDEVRETAGYFVTARKP